MQNEIKNVLSQSALAQCHTLIANAQWLPGTGSAGAQAKHNKTNEEMDQQCASWASINQLVVSTLYSHPEFQSLALPSKVSAAFVSRCKTGMQYGQHIDDPLMGGFPERARYIRWWWAQHWNKFRPDTNQITCWQRSRLPRIQFAPSDASNTRGTVGLCTLGAEHGARRTTERDTAWAKWGTTSIGAIHTKCASDTTNRTHLR